MRKPIKPQKQHSRRHEIAVSDPMALTTLDTTFSAVPELRNRCSSVLANDSPGSGLKLLRLVSRQIRYAMLAVVQGYTLSLDGSNVGLMDELSLLQSTKLSRLRVVVTKDTYGVFSGGLQDWSAHSHQLHSFIDVMGAAIRSITRLEVEMLCMESGSADSVADLLTHLAPACPALQQLRVTGDIERPVFAALGASCASLSCLEVMHGVSSEALRQLHLLLPHLTRCSIVASPTQGAAIPTAHPCCLSLSACTNLTYLDVGHSSLTSDIWQALPLGIRELHCSLRVQPSPDVQVFPSLQHIRCHCSLSEYHVNLDNLVAVLHLAPALKTLVLKIDAWDLPPHGGPGSCRLANVIMPCLHASGFELAYFHGRIAAGLAVTSALSGGEAQEGVNLWLMNGAREEAAQECDIAGFLAMLPPLPLFTGLILWSMIEQGSLGAITRELAAGFPNLKFLVLEMFQTVTSDALEHLSTLLSLQHLSMQDAEVTSSSLVSLCSLMPHLKTICLNECGEFSVSDGELIESDLFQQGSAVTILVNHDY